MGGLRRWACAAAALWLLFSVPGKAAERWYIRVVAENDTPAAQAEKIRVRDAALAACPPEPGGLWEGLDAVRRAAEKAAPCRVEIRPWAPAAGMLPGPTLYITLGAGEGHNWWGILYEDALLMACPGEETEIREERVEFVWPLWQWLCALLGLGP